MTVETLHVLCPVDLHMADISMNDGVFHCSHAHELACATEDCQARALLLDPESAQTVRLHCPGDGHSAEVRIIKGRVDRCSQGGFPGCGQECLGQP